MDWILTHDDEPKIHETKSGDQIPSAGGLIWAIRITQHIFTELICAIRQLFPAQDLAH